MMTYDGADDTVTSECGDTDQCRREDHKGESDELAIQRSLLHKRTFYQLTCSTTRLMTHEDQIQSEQ